MYNPLRAKMKCRSELFNVIKGFRQGGLTSPGLINNSVIPAQSSIESTCIYRGLDVSLLTYADDILNLSRTFSGCENTSLKLKLEYRQISLSFNGDKTVAIDLNLKGCSDKSLQLTETCVPLPKSLIYLKMPIGNSIKETIKLAIQNLEKRQG